MGDKLKSVVEGTVMLAVNQRKSVSVNSIKDLGGIVRILTGAVDLKFNAEIAITFTVEDGFWLVIVAVDGFVSADLVRAVLAVGAIVIIVSAADFVVVNDSSAPFTGRVVRIIAVLTEWCVAVAVV